MDAHGEMGRLRSDLHDEMASLQSDLQGEIGSLRSELHTQLHAATRTSVLGNIALVFTVAAIAFGAARLV